MIIDMHAHLDTNVLGRVGNEETLIRNLERGLYDQAVVSSLHGGFYPTIEELREANRRVYRLMEQHPGQILGYSYVNPMLGQASLDEFRHCVEDLGMVGMKWWVAVRANDPRGDMFYAQASEYGVPILLHAWVKATGNTPPGESFPDDLRQAAQRFPETSFIMAHRGGDWQYGKKAVRDLSNMCVDISGPNEMGIIEEMVADIGADRLVYGTDNVDASFFVGMVNGARITDAERDQIFCGTAQRLLGIRKVSANED
jgi:predicted TIM-barrel fold metal-dependent hydrolase